MATVDEIYADLAAHMIKGLMVHDQMSSYYCFLNLKGYAKCHNYHYVCENKAYIKLKEYYMQHHGKLIKDKAISDPKLIPNSWYAYTRKDVDTTSKRNAVKTGLEKWIEWESDTKNTYTKAYKDLMALNAVADAHFIARFLDDVDEELAQAESLYIKKKTVDFDIGSIMSDQEEKYQNYHKKIKDEFWR